MRSGFAAFRFIFLIYFTFSSSSVRASSRDVELLKAELESRAQHEERPIFPASCHIDQKQGLFILHSSRLLLIHGFSA
jgi:hypothetical protein